MAGLGEAQEGGLAPLALRAHPPEYFRQDEGGAVPAAPLLLGGAGLLVGLWLSAQLLPALPDPAAAVLVLGLGGLIALPWGWGLAVSRGHDLRRYTAGGWLRPLLAGPLVRLVVTGLGGALASALLLLRLTEAGPALWALVVLALPLTWCLMAWLGPWGRTELVGLHARRLVHRTAVALSVSVLTGLSALAGWFLPLPDLAPFEPPAGAGPLVAQVLAFGHLWAGLESFALGQAATFGVWGRGLALLIAALGQATVFGAAASLAVTLALPGQEWLRGLGVASDAIPRPPTGRAGPIIVLALALALFATVVVTSRWLDAQPPALRPDAQVMDLVERIDGVLYRPGTQQALNALRAEALAETETARLRAERLINQGFDSMVAHVDEFLDAYYSLPAEYGRLLAVATGDLEARLRLQLSSALLEGEPFAPLETLRAQTEARLAVLAQREATILAESRVPVGNPAMMRLSDSHPEALSSVFELLSAQQQAAVTRLALAGSAGAVSAAVARQLVLRLARGRVATTTARVMTRAGGPLVAVAVDYGLLRLDAYRNRDTFRAEIIEQIEEQRAAALAMLSPPG
ncbi:MAG: hypothetical protein JJU19_10140 [Pararhodobacter sp.]|nr:hypothetical protein [Pararhodobacter sp.]